MSLRLALCSVLAVTISVIVVEGKGNLRSKTILEEQQQEADDFGRLLSAVTTTTTTTVPTPNDYTNETLIDSEEDEVEEDEDYDDDDAEEEEEGSSNSTSIEDQEVGQLVVVPPTNDRCIDASGPISVTTRSLDGSTEIRFAGTTVVTTKNFDDDLPRCAGLTFTSPSVWFYAYGTGSIVTASTCWPGTDLDTKLSVFQGGNCTDRQCMGGNDDASSTVRGGCEFNSLASRVTWKTEVDQIYYLVVHAFSNKVGNFELSIDALNDQCDYAIELAPGDTIRGDTRGAMAPFQGKIGNCKKGEGLVGEGPSLWYSVNGTGTKLQATTCDSNGKSDDGANPSFKIHVFEGACGDADTCIGGITPTAMTECGTFEWESEMGVKYFILLHASTSMFAGIFDLTVREVAT